MGACLMPSKTLIPSPIVQIHSTLLGSFWLMEVTVCVNNCCYTDFHAYRLGLYIYMQRKITFMENQSTESTYGTCLFYLSYTYSYICSHYLSIADSLKRFSFCCIISSLGVAYGVFVINIFYQYKKKTNEW